MPEVFSDARYALRALRKNPGFALPAIVALALGIGATTAIFTAVNALLLRPLPFRDSGRLVLVWDRLTKLGLNQFPVSFGNYLDYRGQNKVFEDVAAFQYADLHLTAAPGAAADPERVLAMRATPELFPLLGVEPLVGRAFTADEARAAGDGVALIGEALWRRRFGSDPSVVGRPLVLDGELYSVTGVLPERFRFTTRATGAAPEIWLPLAIRPGAPRNQAVLQVVARLRPDVPIERAQTNIAAIAAGIEREYHPYRGPRGEDAGYGASVVGLRDFLLGDLRRGLLVLLGAVGLLLLIACANVANLLLARSTGRRREMAIRAALGAARLRLVRQLLAEGVVLALAGGALGVVLSNWGVAALRALAPPGTATVGDVALDAQVLIFAVLVSIASGVLFSLAPALEASKADLNEGLKVAAVRSRRSASRWFIAGEIALSLVLAIGAGLLMKSFLRLESVRPGFQPARLVTTQVSLPAARYADPVRAASFFEQLLERVGAAPEVQGASMVSRLPLSGGGRGGDPFSIEGRPYDATGKTPQVAAFQAAGLNYFRAMQIPLLAGRDLSERDDQNAARVVVINETMARGFWKSADNALGKRVVIGAPRPGAAWMMVVGVVGDIRNAGLDVSPIPQMYAPHRQNPMRSMTLVVRTRTEAPGAIALLRRHVVALDPELPIYDVNTMEQRLAASIGQPRFQSFLLGAFAALALLLAAVGVYGVVAHAVAQRTREIGVRMALGAQPREVLALMMAQGMWPALAGVVAGLAGAAALSRVLSTLLFEVTPGDPPTFAAAGLLLLAVAFLACYIPARRATRVDPAATLRAE